MPRLERAEKLQPTDLYAAAEVGPGLAHGIMDERQKLGHARDDRVAWKMAVEVGQVIRDPNVEGAALTVPAKRTTLERGSIHAAILTRKRLGREP